MLDFDTLPAPPWYNSSDSGTATVSGGILTVDAPAGYNEFQISKPNGSYRPGDDWTEHASNARGWWIEVRLRIDPISEPGCDVPKHTPSVTIWAMDDVMLQRLVFSPDAVCVLVSWDQALAVPMDTTSAFHVYRLQTRLHHIKLYVDGALALDREVPDGGTTTTALMFGDGNSGDQPSLSYWDYFSYDVSGSDN